MDLGRNSLEGDREVSRMMAFLFTTVEPNTSSGVCRLIGSGTVVSR